MKTKRHINGLLTVLIALGLFLLVSANVLAVTATPGTATISYPIASGTTYAVNSTYSYSWTVTNAAKYHGAVKIITGTPDPNNENEAGTSLFNDSSMTSTSKSFTIPNNSSYAGLWVKLYVRGIGSAGEYGLAAIKYVQIKPLKPILNTPTNPSGTNVYLSWSNTTSGATYYIYRSTSPSSGYTNIGYTTASNYTDSSTKTAGVTYYYKVEAKAKTTTSNTNILSNGVLGDQSDYKSILILPPAPGSAAITNPTASGIVYTIGGNNTFSWAAVTNATRINARAIILSGTPNPGSESEPALGNPLVDNPNLGSGAGSTSFSIQNNTTYAGKWVKLFVQGFNSSGIGGAVDYRYVQIKPLTPNLNKPTQSNGIVSLSWSDTSGAVSYKVYRSTSANTGFSEIGSASATSRNYQDTPPTGTYYYKVAAVASTTTLVDSKILSKGVLGDQSAASDSITVAPASIYTFTVDQTGTHTFPSAVVGYGTQTAKTITVKNTGNQNGIFSISTSSSNFTLNKITTGNLTAGSSTTFTVAPKTGLVAGKYDSTITVNGGTNYGSKTFSVSFTVTSLDPTPGRAEVTNPTTSDTVYTIGSNYILFSWAAVTNATRINARAIILSGTPNPGSESEPALGNSLVDNPNFGPGAGSAFFSIQNNTTYAGKWVKLFVQGFNSSGIGGTVDYRYVQIKPLTPNINKPTQSNGIVSLSWSDTSGAASYKVYRSTSANTGFSEIGSASATLRSYQDTPPAGTYYYKVAAVASTTTLVDSKILSKGVLGDQSAASDSITVAPASIYTFTVDQTGTHTFPSAVVGYGTQTAKTVTVKNTGNQNGTFSISTSSSNFTLNKITTGNLTAGSSTTFTVTPKTGLVAGKYDSTIMVNGGTNYGSKTFDVSFTVTSSSISTLSIKNWNKPGDLENGQSFIIQGVVESNYPITKVTVAVKNNDTGLNEIEESVIPNAQSYNINLLDSKVRFDKLLSGSKTYIITATDTVKTESVSSQFKVIASSRPPEYKYQLTKNNITGIDLALLKTYFAGTEDYLFWYKYENESVTSNPNIDFWKSDAYKKYYPAGSEIKTPNGNSWPVHGNAKTKFQGVFDFTKQVKLKITFSNNKEETITLSELIAGHEGDFTQVPRFQRDNGIRTNVLSTHAYGLAVDLNSGYNVNMQVRGDRTRLEKINDAVKNLGFVAKTEDRNAKILTYEFIYDGLPPKEGSPKIPVELVNYFLYYIAFKTSGFYWGAYFSSTDAMHFSLLEASSKSTLTDIVKDDGSGKKMTIGEIMALHEDKFSSKTVSVPVAGTTQTITKINGLAEPNEPWIHIVSNAKAMEATSTNVTASTDDDNNLTIFVDPNTSDQLRTGTISVTNGDEVETIYINQDGANASLIPSETIILQSALDGEYAVNITSNVSWTASCDADWVHLYPASGFGDGELTVVADENASTSARTATITITGGGVSETITVQQAGYTGYGSNGKFLAPIEAPDPNAIKIYTAEDLDNVRNNMAGSYVLMNDIDLADFNGGQWVPIGGNPVQFTGTFDGQGNVIRNLTITGDAYKDVGLFGYTSDATIKNVGLEDDYIDVYSSSSDLNVGGICGTSYSSISNCYNTGDISSSSSFSSYAGGICGYGSSSISNCYNTGDISSSSSPYPSSSYAGGICGSRSSSISNCYNTGNISSSSSSSSSYAGGICGSSSSSISNCYNTGDISSSSSLSPTLSSYAGGICGSCHSFSSSRPISNCAVLSKRIYAEAPNLADAHSYLISYGGNKNKNLAIDAIQGNISVNDDSDGRITLAEAKEQTTYENLGWDFGNVWQMVPGYDYPQFRRDLSEIKKPDGSITKEASVTEVRAGDGYHYTITVRNSDAATESWKNVTVVDFLPDELDYIGYQVVTGSAMVELSRRTGAIRGGALIITCGDIEPGETVIVEIMVKVNVMAMDMMGDYIKNTAVAMSDNDREKEDSDSKPLVLVDNDRKPLYIWEATGNIGTVGSVVFAIPDDPYFLYKYALVCDEDIDVEIYFSPQRTNYSISAFNNIYIFAVRLPNGETREDIRFSFKPVGGGIEKNKEIIYGDVNEDGNITTTDATMVTRWAGGNTSTVLRNILAADINGDGSITTTDATLITRRAGGNTSAIFPIETRVGLIIRPKGDIDGDGKVTMEDAATLMRMLKGVEEMPTDSIFQKIADVNGDGIIDEDDVEMILRMIVGG